MTRSAVDFEICEEAERALEPYQDGLRAFNVICTVALAVATLCLLAIMKYIGASH